MVTNVDVVGDRVLNGVFHETLLSLDEDKHELTYSIDEGPSPVSPDEISNYEGYVRAHSITSRVSTTLKVSAEGRFPIQPVSDL